MPGNIVQVYDKESTGSVSGTLHGLTLASFY